MVLLVLSALAKHIPTTIFLLVMILEAIIDEEINDIALRLLCRLATTLVIPSSSFIISVSLDRFAQVERLLGRVLQERELCAFSYRV